MPFFPECAYCCQPLDPPSFDADDDPVCPEGTGCTVHRPRGRRRWLTPAEIGTLQRRRDGGASVSALARAYGLDRGVVREALGFAKREGEQRKATEVSHER